MNGSSMRHEVLINNIANANTPNFKRNDVSFQSALEGAINPQLPLKTTKSKHINIATSTTEPLIIQDQETSLRSDGNNVDIDIELASMAENNLYFNSLVNFLSSQLSLLRQAISEGRH